MRRHPKPCIPSVVLPIFQRLKVLRLLMNTRPAPPPPRLVHKRPMRRIHQPDNPMIHIAWQLRHQVRAPKLRRKLRHLRHRRQRLPHAPCPRRRHIHPRKTVPLLARKRTRIRSSSGPASHGSSAKESPCTAPRKAQTAIRDTCKSPSRHRTTQPTAESPDADTGPASQTACLPSSFPAAAEPQAASPSPSCPPAAPPRATPDTNPQRSAPSAALQHPQLAPAHSTQTPSLKQHASHHSLAIQASTRRPFYWPAGGPCTSLRLAAPAGRDEIS